MDSRIARIGTAGWSIPSRFAADAPTAGSHLQRYGSVLDAVEINSSFHRPHRQATYERWASAVGPDFRFAVKLPKTITHVHKLKDCHDLAARFTDEVAGLGGKLGPILVQLPPSLAFCAKTATEFFAMLSSMLGGTIVCEPRHPSWFEHEADGLLSQLAIARVAADPARVPIAAEPGGWRGLAYFRMHGAPRIYYSDYTNEIDAHVHRISGLRAMGVETWFIYDNTAAGAAFGDALRVARRSSGGVLEARIEECQPGRP